MSSQLAQPFPSLRFPIPEAGAGLPTQTGSCKSNTPAISSPLGQSQAEPGRARQSQAELSSGPSKRNEASASPLPLTLPWPGSVSHPRLDSSSFLICPPVRMSSRSDRAVRVNSPSRQRDFPIRTSLGHAPGHNTNQRRVQRKGTRPALISCCSSVWAGQ